MAHVWPADDSFTAGATAYGDWPSAYVRCALWNAATIAHPVASSYSSTINAGDLTDAFSTTQGGDSSLATPSANPAGYLWRALESSADGTVRLAFGMRSITGAPSLINALTTALVFARVSGSSYTSSTHTHSAIQNGYVFGLLNSASLGLTWYLIRINSGTRTVIASSAADLSAAGEFPKNVGEIYLTLSDVSGNVRLRAGYTGRRTAEIFDTTDSSGSKITAAGRYGFALNGHGAVTGGTFAMYSSRFEVVEGSTTRVRDEWQRAYRPGAVVSQPVTGYVGSSMLCGWAGDFDTVQTYDKKLRRSTVSGLGDRVNVDPATEATGFLTDLRGSFMSSQRRCSDPRSQNRSIQFRFSSLKVDGTSGSTNPTPTRAVGIHLRSAASGGPTATTVPANFVGYIAVVRRDDAAGTSKAQLYRNNPGSVLLAEKTVTASLDTNYTLRFDAYNQLDSAGDNSGPVVLRVFLDGVQVVLDAVSTSVSVSAAGTVVDGTSSRIVSGTMEGLNIFTVNGDKTTFVDTWAQSTLTNPSGTASSAQASIAVEGEADNDSGQTFTIPYAWGVEEYAEQEAVATPFESGHVRTNFRHTAGRRRWSINAPAITEAERDALLAFWDAHKGTELAFSFAPPYGGATVKAHFADDRLGTLLADRGIYSYSIELEELFA